MSQPQPQPDRDRLLDHEYDGIQEYDNPMPRWWVNLFWATIIFSIIYALNFIQGWGSGPGRLAQYARDMAEFRAQHPQPSGEVDGTQLAALLKDPQAIAEGKTVFAANCAACHAADGGGIIGPNLTDAYWLHGSQPTQILRTVSDGVLAKGMPAWGKLLKPQQVTAVTAYVASLQGTTPAKPKAPEGTPVTE